MESCDELLCPSIPSPPFSPLCSGSAAYVRLAHRPRPKAPGQIFPTHLPRRSPSSGSSQCRRQDPSRPMIVPFDKGQPSAGQTAAPDPQPSEAQLLMALATMHAQGRFDVAQSTSSPDLPEINQALGTGISVAKEAGKSGRLIDFSKMRPSTNVEDYRKKPGQTKSENNAPARQGP